MNVYKLNFGHSVIVRVKADSLEQAIQVAGLPKERLLGYSAKGTNFECDITEPIMSKPHQAPRVEDAGTSSLHKYPGEGLSESLLGRVVWSLGRYKHMLLVLTLILLFLITGTIEYNDCVNRGVC